MTVDGLRGASISYNILNLPEEVCLGNEKVSYIYTSAGEKLATRVGSSLTYYRGPLVYSGNNLLYLVHPEGLTRKSTIGFVIITRRGIIWEAPGFCVTRAVTRWWRIKRLDITLSAWLTVTGT